LRFKLDENLGRLARVLLEAPGHDVATVHEEDLCSASDDRIIEASLHEKRCLVTLDLEFGNPLRYRAANYAGIAVLRLPAKPAPEDLENAVRTLIAGLQPTINRHLWIIEAGRIRVYQDPDEDPLENGFAGDSKA
jgi:predicted nuclease of predicted toxin-antitoxin system